MSLYILDTDHVSLFQRNHSTVVQHLSAVDSQSLATTIVTVEEQMRGYLAVINQATSGIKLIRADAALQERVTYFNSIQILPFDPVANAGYETLRQQKIRIGTNDLRISAIVLAVNGVLVTRNWKDFAQVPNLELVDWTIP